MKKLVSLILTFALVISLGSFAFAAENDITVTVDCDKVVFDQQPIILEGRTLVPLRAIFEKLGAEVTWDDPTKTATAIKGDITIKIQNQNNIMTKNEEQITLDVPAQIINSRTLVPVRAISEAFGCSVDWFGNTRTVAVYSDELLKTVYNATMLLGKKEYNPDDTFTYGELSNAAITLILNEKETAYPGLGTEEPFKHTYARDFFYACSNIFGEEFMAIENIDKKATLADAAEVLSYAAGVHDEKHETISTEVLLNGKDGTKEATMKQFAEMVTRIDEVSPILVKIVISKGKVLKNVQTKINKDLSSYPQNANKYRVILDELANSFYEKEIYNGESAHLPIEGYNFVRDFRDIFIGILAPWVDKASEAGVEMELEYYPSLCVNNKNGYTMRVICNVISVPADKQLTASDIFTNTPGSKTVLRANTSYVIDLCNNGFIDSVTMPSENVTMKRIATLK